MNQKKILQICFSLLALCVLLGAMGAHVIEKSISPKELATFNTGIRYLTYHTLALLTIASNNKLFASLLLTRRLIFFGMIFFSGNCILYATTGVKLFAMLVPIGGFAFIFAWIIGIFELRKINS